ncbi:hypothetical protein [Tichowtungia aerotolerans]|uniref:B box-type domain-containing protein n=1 Tax=Tichowtungia aerotolerans TaxID=2697043 RepID=A0A6P1M1E0_9BACT|nr:hypothetical protein [Tichowtungia aerotolerans]QHI68400.1 hypothetical protein GT409_02650 [Tichowtungia aerotolerans]
MNRFSVKCPKCNRPLAAEFYNQKSPLRCEGCRTRLTVRAFPALYRQDSTPTHSAPAQQEDAACFYHPSKKAEQICSDCGRFLCSLCALPVGDKILCTSCLERQRKDDKGHEHKARRMRHDKLAMMLAGAALLMLLFSWFFPVIPAVLALSSLFVAIRYWKNKPEFSPGYTSRMALALILSILITASSIAATIYFVGKFIRA